EKAGANQRLARHPEAPCRSRIDRIRSYAVDPLSIRGDIAGVQRRNIRVEAEDAAHGGNLLAYSAPYMRGRALRDRLHVLVRINHRLFVRVEVPRLHELLYRNVLGQADNDASGMQGE